MASVTTVNSCVHGLAMTSRNATLRAAPRPRLVVPPARASHHPRATPCCKVNHFILGVTMASYSVNNPGPPIGAYRNLTATFLRYRDSSRAHSRPFNGAKGVCVRVFQAQPTRPGARCARRVRRQARVVRFVCFGRAQPCLVLGFASHHRAPLCVCYCAEAQCYDTCTTRVRVLFCPASPCQTARARTLHDCCPPGLPTPGAAAPASPGRPAAWP